MKIRYGNLFGFFLLLVFAFPLLVKSVHDFEHRVDFHCHEKTDTHYHEKEHSCELCDYQLNQLHELTFQSFAFETFQFNLVSLNTECSRFVSPYQIHFSSRGPPVFM
jgi:hypothetical protein